MSSQIDTVSTSTNSGSQPQFGRPLVPYFKTTIANSGDENKKKSKSKKYDELKQKELLTINFNHDITEEQKNEQRTLILPKGNQDFSVRRFNKDGYFEYDTIDLKEIKQDLNEADIRLVTEKPTQNSQTIKEIALLDENGQVLSGSKNTGQSQSYYDKMITMSESLKKNGRSKYLKDKHKKQRKKRKSKSPHKKTSNKKEKENYEDITDEETTSANSSSDQSSDDEQNDDLSSKSSLDISSILQSGKLLSPMDLLNLSTSQKPISSNNSPSDTSNQQISNSSSQVQTRKAIGDLDHLTQPLPLPGFIQPSNDSSSNGHAIPHPNVPPNFNSGQQIDIMPMFGIPNLNFPFFPPPHPQMMLYPDPNFPMMNPVMPMMHQPQPVHLSEQLESPKTETEILKILGLSHPKKNNEKYSGGSWSNSPPPSSLPAPRI